MVHHIRLHSQCRGLRFDPCSGNWIPHAVTKDLHATTETWCSQIINKINSKKKKSHTHNFRAEILLDVDGVARGGDLFWERKRNVLQSFFSSRSCSVRYRRQKRPFSKIPLSWIDSHNLQSPTPTCSCLVKCTRSRELPTWKRCCL